ncbi:MAG TPA: urease subunit alpha [Streptosporangiaceae bacterium]
MIELGDTGLTIRVEADASRPGDEFRTGFGRTARDGIHLLAATAAATCDVVVTNVTLADPVLGIRVVSIGVREGRISAIGRAGNPDTLDGVDVVVGTGTTIIPGDGLIATPGAVDTHVHLLSPRVLEAALSSGVTTVIGQEIGPVWGVGMNSQWLLRRAFAAFDAWPVNIGFLARGSSSDPAPLVEGLLGGACGFKVHEDLGAHPRCLDTALTVAGQHDVQVALHTDGLNEAGCVSDTLAVASGRVFHAFHVEGCGGGHAPNVLELAGRPSVITSSTNPTLPYGRDALAEHLDMIALVHGLDLARTEDAQLARDRLRAGTMAAEGPLHDLGVIPITSSDAQGMGRAGETIRRTFAMAATMAAAEGPGKSDKVGENARDDAGDDNERVLRYLAKLTINPAIAHGLAHEVGSLETGKLADIVLWDPAFFGAKPFLVLKAGVPAWGVTGDPNAAIDTAQPLVLGPQFGGCGATPAEISVMFTAQAAVDAGLSSPRRLVPVRDTRRIGAHSMVRHGRLAEVRVDPATGRTTMDGAELAAGPASQVPLSRLYFL